MSLTIILTIAIILTIVFHFVGIYAGAKKIVWIVLALFWAGSISIAMQEIKPQGYIDLETIKGIDTDLDATIQEAMPEVTIYEMLVIKKKQHEQGVKVDMFGHAHKK